MAALPRPVPRRSPAAPTETFPVGIVHNSPTRVTVMWDVNPHLRHTVEMWEGTDPAEMAAAVAQGIVLLAGEAQKLHARMSVNVSHPGMALVAAQMMAQCPNRCIELVHADQQICRMRTSLSELRRATYLLRRAAAARADLDGCALSVDPDCIPRKPPVVIGTDASRSTRPGGPVAFAWVGVDGTFHSGAVKRGSINLGELRGIYMAVCAFQRRDMRILTDSQHAVAVLAGQRHPSSPAEAALRDKVWAATARDKGRAITIQWVPGHAGIPLNEAANRLAFNEYRRASLGLDQEVSHQTASSIVAEYLTSLSEPVPDPVDPWCCTIRDGKPTGSEIETFQAA